MKIRLHYVEFGKVFFRSQKGAEEFQALDRSHDQLAGRDSTYDRLYKGGLKSSRERRGHISAFFYFNNDLKRHLFVQIQNRRENEMITTDPDSGRAFSQVRMSIVPEKESANILYESFSKRLGLYACLLYGSDNGDCRLKDYIEERGVALPWEVEPQKIEDFKAFSEENRTLLKGIVEHLYQQWRSASPENSKKDSVIAYRIKLGRVLLDKVRLIDAVQYLLYPVMGPLSFSVNYLPDAPVKFGIFDDISALHSEYYTVVLVSESEILRYSNSETYFSCLQELHFTDLYSKTLTKYLAKRIDPDDTVKLYGIIKKLGEPDWVYSTDVIRSILLKWRKQIDADDWKIIVEKRFDDFDKTIELLTIPDLSLSLLSEFFRILRSNFPKYLNLYCVIFLKPLNDQDRDKLKKHFRRTVDQMPPTVLNAIFNNQKELFSLRHIVDSCAGELSISEDVNDLKDALYFSLIDGWVGCKAVILKGDLEALIEKLPKTNEILANIVKQGGEDQRELLRSLDTSFMSAWVNSSRDSEVRNLYYHNKQNLLLDISNDIISAQVNHGALASKSDLESLIANLPETNEILSRIVKKSSEVQKAIFHSLDASSALYWLKNTCETESRNLYVQDKHDLLLDALSNTTNPSQELILYILTDEMVLNQEGTWLECVSKSQELYQKKWASQFPEIENFFSLSLQVQQDVFQNQKIFPKPKKRHLENILYMWRYFYGQ